MTSPSPRHRLRAVTAVVVAATAIAGPATAATGSAGDAPQAAGTRALLGAGQSVAPSGGVSAAGLSDTCPSGTARGATVLQEGFEDGLPDEGLYTNGWEIRSGGAAVGGSYAASDAPGAADDNHVMFLEDSYVRRGARTFISFSVRGVSGEDNMGLVVNDESWALLDLEPAVWSPIRIDITAATDDYDDGYLEAFFGHVRDTAAPGSTLAVDDVTIYHCVPAASGVRGDWTGGGTVDVLGVGRDGTLTMYPGRGDGTLGRGVPTGTGWNAMTWLGSPGDLDGDDRTDLLARRSDGNLYRYSGRGDGAVAGKGVQVGTRWNGMTALATGGDVDGNGAPDLLARRADGVLFRYPITSSGSVSAGRQVGTGWNGITTFVVVGDTDGDGRDDVLGIDRVGRLYLYAGTAGGLANGRQVGSGWTGMQLVNSPGDLDGDGRDDVVARSPAGDLYLYAGTARGVAAGIKIGSGWSGTARLV